MISQYSLPQIEASFFCTSFFSTALYKLIFYLMIRKIETSTKNYFFRCISSYNILLFNNISKNPSFSNKIKKLFSLIAKGLEIVKLPRQNDFRTFCMSEEAEKVYQKLEEVISIC